MLLSHTEHRQPLHHNSSLTCLLALQGKNDEAYKEYL